MASVTATLCLGLVLLWTRERGDAILGDTHRTRDAMDALDQMRIDVSDAESSVLASTIAPDPALDAAALAETEAARASLARYVALREAGPAAAAELEALSTALEHRIATLRGDLPTRLAARRRLRGHAEAAVVAARARLAQREADRAEVQTTTRGFAVGTIVVALLGMLALFAGLERENAARRASEQALRAEVTRRASVEDDLRVAADVLAVCPVGLGALEIAPDGALRVLRANPVAESLAAAPARKGTDLRALGRGEDAASRAALYRRVAETQQPERVGDVVLTVDGDERTYHGEVVPLGSRRAAIVYVDVTRDRRALREQEEAVRAVTLARERAEGVNRELDAFSYSVSHDLRAPLRAIEGFARALEEDYGASFDATASDFLTRIRRAAVRMGELIDDLLSLSRVTRAELRREEVDIGAIARSVAATLEQAEPGREVETVIEGPLVVHGDPRLLRIVLENLLGNAWKFTRYRARARIEVGAERSEGASRIFVRDDGAGFDPSLAGRLFGAFSRLHGHADFPGTGIGLATVRRIVHRHGGRVWAEGEIDRGATFSFTIPDAPPENTWAGLASSIAPSALEPDGAAT